MDTTTTTRCGCETEVECLACLACGDCCTCPEDLLDALMDEEW